MSAKATNAAPAFAFPARPVTHVSEHLLPMCPVSTHSLRYCLESPGKASSGRSFQVAAPLS
jgi:hypothetical protein